MITHESAKKSSSRMNRTNRCLDKPYEKDDANTPRALAVTATLSSNLFLAESNRFSDGEPYLDLKIDVFLNGELCHSEYLPWRRWKDEPTVKWNLRCSGHRVGRLFERPWILASSGQASGDMSLQMTPQDHMTKFDQRWAAINDRLRLTVQGLEITDGTRSSHLASYLRKLIEVKQPKGLPWLARYEFAAIDIICRAGRGRKAGYRSPYLLVPELMQLTDSSPSYVRPSQTDHSQNSLATMPFDPNQPINEPDITRQSTHLNSASSEPQEDKPKTRRSSRGITSLLLYSSKTNIVTATKAQHTHVHMSTPQISHASQTPRSTPGVLAGSVSINNTSVNHPPGPLTVDRPKPTPHSPTWPVSPLNDGCVITYLPEALRQTGSQKPGFFREWPCPW